MDLEKKFRNLTGSKITFETTNAAYEGLIFFVSRHVIMFKNVHALPDRQYVGDLTIYFKNIKSYTVVDCTELKKITKERNREYISSELISSNFSVNVECNCEEEFIFKLPPELSSDLPNDYLILNNVNSEFQQAVDYISRQSTIGVSLLGANISRLGHLSWITICTPLCIFLFDIEVLGQQALDGGLRDVFQNQDIEKVVHDCRQCSDCLTHLFRTDLVNVFDTQIADYIVNMQVHGDETVIKKVNSLDSCLINYLKVPKEFLYNEGKYKSCDFDDNFFRKRPSSNECLNIAVKHALYLILLKQKLTELMLNPFQSAVDAYLNVYTNMCEAELVLETASTNQIAPKILTNNLQKIKYQEVPEETSINPFNCYFKHPQTGAIIDIKNESERSQNKLVIDSTQINDLEKNTLSEIHGGVTENIQSTITKSPCYSRSLEVKRDSNNLAEIKKQLERPKTDYVNRCPRKATEKYNPRISKNIDVTSRNANTCYKKSVSSNNNINKKKVQNNNGNSKDSYKFNVKNKVNESNKSIAKVSDTSLKLLEKSESLYISEKSETSSKLCFIPSGMKC